METALIVKLAIPFVAAAVTGGVKALLEKYKHKLPSWLTPILAAAVGAAAGAVTGDPTAIADSMATGAALGGGAPMVREVYRQVLPKTEAPPA